MTLLNRFTHTRTLFSLMFLLCLGVMTFALYLQKVLLQMPCPLCELQRIMFIVIGFLSFLAVMLNPKRRAVLWFSFFIMIFALLGAALAGHQLWLEGHPPTNANACGMDLDYLLTALPFSAAIKIAIMGTGDCAAVTWRMLGLSIPAWSLMTFFLLMLLAILQINMQKKD